MISYCHVAGSQTVFIKLCGMEYELMKDMDDNALILDVFHPKELYFENYFFHTSRVCGAMSLTSLPWQV